MIDYSYMTPGRLRSSKAEGGKGISESDQIKESAIASLPPPEIAGSGTHP
jgi:hypothetical protein